MSPNPEYTPAEINEAIEWLNNAANFYWVERWNLYQIDEDKEYQHALFILSSLKVKITDGKNGGKDECM